MNSKVLVVGTPSEGLRQSLSGEFQVQNCPDPTEALSIVAVERCQSVICCVENEALALSFLNRAITLFPGIRIALIVPKSWSDTVAAINCNSLLLVPTDSRPAMARANIQNFLRDQIERSQQSNTLQASVNGSVTALFEILSIVDPYSASLGQRLRYAVDLFCKTAGMPMSWELETGALLAEIGVLTIPVRMMMKVHSGQDLSSFERDMLAHVPERGADLLQQIPCFALAAQVVRYQDKNFDGGGLPSNSLSGERIPLGARILKVLNDLFKLKENGKTQEQAIAEMEQRGDRYDPRLLAVARTCFDVSLPAHTAASMLPTGVKDLRPGQLLVSNVETDDGVLVIRDGQVISPRLLHKLRNFAFTSGIREPIYVIDLLESRAMTTTFHNITQTETTFIVKGP